ncbi:hypothetical protein C7C46_15985 [Streptomyces tateyamensis]|uniref:DUF4190 domain-containing protein n=1 Tax=Streptomyces tateyamensis TaxID=565073 RepID=A0A2V4N435_9ACTN|nr:hypothetical protein C7C46_15985 [Streptomyces tateyamensis]
MQGAPVQGAPSPWLPPGGSPPPGWDPRGLRPQHSGTNGLAIASLVTGLSCCLWPAALGLGIGALVQLRKRHQRGKGLAIAGVALGLLGLLVGIVSTTLVVVKGRISLTGKTKTTEQLRVGDCFTRSPFGSQVVTVACDMHHDAEVAAVVHLSASSFPGSAAAQADAQQLCDAADFSYVYDLWAWSRTLRAGEYAPTSQAQWNTAKGTAVCYLTDSATGGRTRPVRDDASTLSTDQYAFLNAVHNLDLDARLAGRDRVKAVASDLRNAQAALERVRWTGARPAAVTTYIAQLAADQPSWQAAAQDTTTPVVQLLTRLTPQDPTVYESAARTALGLPDRDGSDLTVPLPQAL